jgi:hypothetical protein
LLRLAAAFEAATGFGRVRPSPNTPSGS